MSARRIVLVRHGQPHIEEDVPSTAWKLSAAGREAASALAEKLRGFSFASITSSPEPKAIGTAQAIAAKLNLTVEIDAGLAEHKRSKTGFVSREEQDARIAVLFAQPDTLVFGDETANQALARFQTVIDPLSPHTDGDIIAVTHSTILSIYVSRLLKIDPMPFWRALGLPAAVVIADGAMTILNPPLGRRLTFY